MNELSKNLCHLMTHRAKVDEKAFSDLMTQIMSGYPEVGWELGVMPGDSNKDLLSLTIRNDVVRLNHLGEQLSLPITEDDWLINIGIPPREWELFFQLTTEKNNVYDIEASLWCWEAEWIGNFVELKMYIPKMLYREGISSDAVNIAIIGELGELNTSKYINKVTLEQISKHNLYNGQPMGELRKEFVKHYPCCYFSEFLGRNG